MVLINIIIFMYVFNYFYVKYIKLFKNKDDDVLSVARLRLIRGIYYFILFLKVIT